MQIGTFSIIKDSIPIQEVCDRYGLESDQRGKYICPSHNDKHPSASVDKEHNRLKCFACGESFSNIDLTMKLIGMSNTEAAAKLNDDFHLGLSLDKPTAQADIKHLQREKRLDEAFTAWEAEAWETMNNLYRTLSEIKRIFKPTDPSNPLSKHYIWAADKIDRVEYILDILTTGTAEEKTQCFIDYRKEIAENAKYCCRAREIS